MLRTASANKARSRSWRERKFATKSPSHPEPRVKRVQAWHNSSNRFPSRSFGQGAGEGGLTRLGIFTPQDAARLAAFPGGESPVRSLFPFQPHRGKPAVRNDREGRGSVGIIRTPAH